MEVDVSNLDAVDVFVICLAPPDAEFLPLFLHIPPEDRSLSSGVPQFP